MARISYSEEEDYPGQFFLWQANVARSLKGKKGQAALRDLEAALLALPEKKLIPYHLTRKGDVCTTGALVAHRMVTLGQARDAALAELEDETTGCGNIWCGHSKSNHTPGCKGCASWVSKGHSWAKPCPVWTEPDDDWDAEDDEGEAEDFAQKYGVPRLVAWKLVELNDMQLEFVTPEERYDRVLKWTQDWLSA